jgi:hypothetical protein
VIRSEIVKEGLHKFWLLAESKRLERHGFISGGSEVAFINLLIPEGIILRNDGLLIVKQIQVDGSLINNGTVEIDW